MNYEKIIGVIHRSSFVPDRDWPWILIEIGHGSCSEELVLPYNQEEVMFHNPLDHVTLAGSRYPIR